jgi:glutathione S-transferase
MTNTTMDHLNMLYGGALDPAYGYLLLVVGATYCISFWQGFMVGRMRTKLNVDYPAMYSDTEPLFNCYQRAHQNTLEKIPLFLILLLVAGLFNAKIATILGFLWIISRVIYSFGYYSGKPKNRVAGSLMSLMVEVGLFTMLVLQAGQLARWWTIEQVF